MMLEGRDLVVRYPGAAEPALDGVNILSVLVVRVGALLFDVMGSAVSNQFLEINMRVIDFEFLNND